MFLQQLINGISLGGIYALISSGYAMIYSLLGFSNWAHGEVAMMGAYVAIVSMTTITFPFIPAAIIGLAGAGVISVFNERFFYRPIRERRTPTVFLMIAAMGLSIVYQNSVIVFFGSKFLRYPLNLPTVSMPIGTIRLGVYDLISLIVSVIALVALEFLINRTKTGLGIRAIASNSYTASLLGINVNKMFTLVFFLAGSLAGAAGVLVGLKYNVYPTMGNIGSKAFIAAVIGGLGSVRGAIAGAIILGIIETMVAGYLNSSLRDLITFMLLIVMLIVRPSGLMGQTVEEKA